MQPPINAHSLTGLRSQMAETVSGSANLSATKGGCNKPSAEFGVHEAWPRRGPDIRVASALPLYWRPCWLRYRVCASNVAGH
jgi:hypothetical protein